MLSLIANFAFQVFLIRNLSPGDVGLINLSLTIFNVVALLGIFGLDRSIVRQIARYSKGRGLERSVDDKAFIVSAIRITWINLLWIFPVAWYVSAPLIQGFFNKSELIPLTRILLISLPFFVFTKLFLGILQSYKAMKPMVLIEKIILPSVNLIGIVLLLVFSKIQTGNVVLLLVISTTIVFSIAVLAVRDYIPKILKYPPIARGVYSEMMVVSGPLLGASLLNFTNSYTELILLGRFSTSQEVGLFSVSLKIAITLTIIFQAINVIIAPFIAEAYSEDDSSKFHVQHKTVTRWGVTLTLPFAVIMLLGAGDIMPLLNPEYNASIPIFMVLVSSQLIYVLAGPVALALTMTRYMNLNFINLVVTLAVSIVLDLILIPRFGAIGAAVASFLSILCINALRIIQTRRLIQLNPFDWDYFKPIVSAGITSILAVILFNSLTGLGHAVHLLILCAFVLISYGLLLFLLKINETDARILTEIVSSFSKFSQRVFLKG